MVKVWRVSALQIPSVLPSSVLIRELTLLVWLTGLISYNQDRRFSFIKLAKAPQGKHSLSEYTV